uniref:Zinc finger HIT-type containing 6 n=1 Tax=Pseudonaja textilis TaxID=8673 RepID=A0A670YH79_PSETE
MKYSCSLACVKKHKALFSCNGIREKAAFVSMNEFSNLTLLSDYRFLEDGGRMTDCAARDTISHKPKSNRFVNFLRNRARRCKIYLQTLPIGFTKRRENSTFYSNKEQKFYWHLKLIFPQSHAKFTEQRVPDDKPLCDILKTYIDPQECDPVKQQRYQELDANKSLLDNLKGKVVIEYPTLHVVLRKFTTDMVILGQNVNKGIRCIF